MPYCCPTIILGQPPPRIYSMRQFGLERKRFELRGVCVGICLPPLTIWSYCLYHSFPFGRCDIGRIYINLVVYNVSTSLPRIILKLPWVRSSKAKKRGDRWGWATEFGWLTSRRRIHPMMKLQPGKIMGEVMGERICACFPRRYDNLKKFLLCQIIT